jgi:hypothetical protein
MLNQIDDYFEKYSVCECDKTSINFSINKPKQNRTTGWPKRREELNIEMILK